MKRFWWHCTSDYHGETWTASRRPPKHRASGEPDTPRLCVAPTVAECFAAVLFRAGPVYCYRTTERRSAVAPRNVWDAVLTRERWLIPPATLRLERTVATLDVERVQEMVTLYHLLTRRSSTLHTRACELAIAADVLGAAAIRERARRILGVLGIEDAEEYLFNLSEGNQ